MTITLISTRGELLSVVSFRMYWILLIMHICLASQTWQPTTASSYNLIQPPPEILLPPDYPSGNDLGSDIELTNLDTPLTNSLEPETTHLGLGRDYHRTVMFGWKFNFVAFLVQFFVASKQIELCKQGIHQSYGCGMDPKILALAFSLFAVLQLATSGFTGIQAHSHGIRRSDCISLAVARGCLVIGISGISLMNPTGENMITLNIVALMVILLYELFFFVLDRRIQQQ